MTLTLFDTDGYKLQITGFRFGGSLFSPNLILDGRMIDPKGNGMLIEGVHVSLNQIKALLAFFQTPDDADLREEAKKAAQKSFTDSITGIMGAAKGD